MPRNRLFVLLCAGLVLIFFSSMLAGGLKFSPLFNDVRLPVLGASVGLFGVLMGVALWFLHAVYLRPIGHDPWWLAGGSLKGALAKANNRTRTSQQRLSAGGPGTAGSDRCPGPVASPPTPPRRGVLDVPWPVVVCDRQTRLLMHNDEARRLFDAETNLVLGTELRELCSELPLALSLARFSSRQREADAVEDADADVTFLGRIGNSGPYHCRMTSLTLEDGQRVALVEFGPRWPRGVRV